MDPAGRIGAGAARSGEDDGSDVGTGGGPDRTWTGRRSSTRCSKQALRIAGGESMDDHRRRIGELWAQFSAVAAANPNAWVREA